MNRFIEYSENPVENLISADYGRAIRILSSISKRRDEKLKDIYARLWPAIKLNQIIFLYNSWGVAVAFASWAFLTPEVERLITNDNSYLLDISEWNEGDRLWIIDFYAPYGDARNLARKLRSLHKANYYDFSAIRIYEKNKSNRIIDALKFHDGSN